MTQPDINDVMPRWCPHCATNGYHKPENCPERAGSDVRSEVLALVAREREAWTEQFAGGMLPFDNAYWNVRHAGGTAAEGQAAGVRALLDAFCERLTAALVEREIWDATADARRGGGAMGRRSDITALPPDRTKEDA